MALETRLRTTGGLGGGVIASPLGVTAGGTGLTSGTSGGILGFTATTTLASSVLLTANALVLGGGVGATPTSMASLGTTTTVLHGNAVGAPTFSSVSLTADITGTLAVGNGGSGTATQFTAGSVIFAGTNGVYTQNNTNLFWDNTNIRLLLGSSTTAGTAYGRLGQLFEINTSANFGGFQVVTWSATASQGVLFDICKSASNTIGTQVAMASGEALGAISWRGSTGSAFATGTFVQALTEEIWTTTASGARLVFATTANTTTTNSIRMAILNTGVIKVSSSITAYGRIGELLEIDTSANYGGISFNTWSATGGQATVLDFNHSKSSTVGTHTVVANGDILGHLIFRGSDGTAFQNSSMIKGEIDGATINSTSMPGRIIFATAASGSVSLTERIRINNDGGIQIGGTGTSPGKARVAINGGTAIATTDVTLSAEWGANATVSAVTGTDSRGTITVTTSTIDTPTANPTVTLTFKDGTWTTAPFAISCMVSSSTGPTTVSVSITISTTTLIVKYNGTPTATSALTYIFSYHVLG